MLFRAGDEQACRVVSAGRGMAQRTPLSSNADLAGDVHRRFMAPPTLFSRIGGNP
jgi:hypothetical protein